jgi:predicted nucleic acid-binding protein
MNTLKITDKIIIFDSSTIINLTMNGLLDLLSELKKTFSGKFIISHSVKLESVDRPSEIKKFELGALKISKLLEEGIFELPESIGLSEESVKNRAREILRMINHVFIAKNEFMQVIHDGEASCLALSLLAGEKGIESVIAIDERTTRMLGEKPENLQKLFQSKLHTSIKMVAENIPEISKIKFIRSSEIVYIAWKKKLVDFGNGKALDALLYATKFKGSSISREEIEEIKKLS